MEEVSGLLFDFDITFEEFEFHRWSELPVDVKMKILEYIPFPTLRNFMFLSKESFLLVTGMNNLIFYVHLSNIGPSVGFFVVCICVFLCVHIFSLPIFFEEKNDDPAHGSH
ncbi:hypothetical protein Y032_0030g2197 [Ancylostoma ceylanicum]|uniref:F-box domain-containing protein n=1 Tax=Ancylostoma ceylanicum TaxID=53326 RepID=A0A016URV4_9BILA|nr:hypothetical protein Y032_0030g2197 [Ancylostoma ceylanicum]